MRIRAAWRLWELAMYMPAVMAFLHHLSAFTVVGALVAEVVLFKPPLTIVLARRLVPAPARYPSAVRYLQDAVAELLAEHELRVGGHPHEDFVEFQLAGARVADDVASAQVIDEVAEHRAVEEFR